MKIFASSAVAGAVFVLAACQPATEMADTPEQAAEIVGVCEFPNEQRDTYLLEQIAKGNDPAVIAETGAAFESRGANLEESGSYQNYLAIVTGQPHPFGPQQAANSRSRHSCISQHQSLWAQSRLSRTTSPASLTRVQSVFSVAPVSRLSLA